MLIYITHPQHGAMHVYSEDELRRHEAWGWSRAEMPSGKVKEVTIEVRTPSVTIDAPSQFDMQNEPPAASAPASASASAIASAKRKPGRPKKGE